jgi:hypothetical protein
MSALIALAAQAGLPILEKVLNKKLGDQNGALAASVIKAIADRAGTPLDDLPSMAETTPGRVIEAMRQVEASAPDMLAAYDRDLQLQLAALAAEQDDPAWMRAWRPGWMYLLGFLWLWNLVLLHIANALWKISLPALPQTDLLALTGLFLSLYMGGHTVLRALGKVGDK